MVPGGRKKVTMGMAVRIYNVWSINFVPFLSFLVLCSKQFPVLYVLVVFFCITIDPLQWNVLGMEQDLGRTKLKMSFVIEIVSLKYLFQ